MSDFALERVLAEKRANIYSQITEITDAAAAENRDLTADESARFDAGSADMDQLAHRITQMREVREANKDAEEYLTSALGRKEERTAPGERDVAAEFRALANAERREVTIAPESRDLTKGSSTAGGVTVPTSFYNKLQEHLVETSGVLMANPTVWNTSSGENLDIPVTTSHGAATALIAEANAISESDPAFTKRTLGAYKFGQIIQVSTELVQDTAVDLLGYLARSAGRNLGLALAPYLITGTGSSQPSGLVTGSTLGKTGGTSVSGVFTYNDLLDLYHSVIAPYRNSPSCAWIMKDATLATVRKLQDSSGSGAGVGAYIFTPGTVGAPDQILGKPVYTDPNVPATAISAKSVYFGDISQFWVRFAGGVRFERSDEFAFNLDLVTFKAVLRADSILVDQTGAIKYFAGGAS